MSVSADRKKIRTGSRLLVSLERTKNFTRPCMNMSLQLFKGFNATICFSFTSEGPMVGNCKHAEMKCAATVRDVRQKTSPKLIFRV